jgi:hypothetical protein
MVEILRFFETAFGSPTAVNRDVKKTVRPAAGRSVGKTVLCSQARARNASGSYISIDGRELKTIPASGIVIRAK